MMTSDSPFQYYYDQLRILQVLLSSCADEDFCYLNLARIAKFKYERKDEKNSDRSSKMTPSCKWTWLTIIKTDFFDVTHASTGS